MLFVVQNSNICLFMTQLTEQIVYQKIRFNNQKYLIKSLSQILAQKILWSKLLERKKKQRLIIEIIRNYQKKLQLLLIRQLNLQIPNNIKTKKFYPCIITFFITIQQIKKQKYWSKQQFLTQITLLIQHHFNFIKNLCKLHISPESEVIPFVAFELILMKMYFINVHQLIRFNIQQKVNVFTNMSKSKKYNNNFLKNQQNKIQILPNKTYEYL